MNFRKVLAAAGVLLTMVLFPGLAGAELKTGSMTIFTQEEATKFIKAFMTPAQDIFQNAACLEKGEYESEKEFKSRLKKSIRESKESLRQYYKEFFEDTSREFVIELDLASVKTPPGNNVRKVLHYDNEKQKALIRFMTDGLFSGEPNRARPTVFMDKFVKFFKSDGGFEIWKLNVPLKRKKAKKYDIRQNLGVIRLFCKLGADDTKIPYARKPHRTIIDLKVKKYPLIILKKIDWYMDGDVLWKKKLERAKQSAPGKFRDDCVPEAMSKVQ